MNKINRNVPQSVKTQRKIDEAVQQALEKQHRVHLGIFEKKEQRIDELEQGLAQLTAQYTSALDQMGQRQIQRSRPPEITEGPSLRYSPTLESTNDSGFWVANWRNGWKWFSNLALTAIVAINTVPVSPEMLDALPPDIRQQVTIGLGVIGILARFINQSKAKPAPSLVENEVDDV
uniref:DUF4414 domain-containing protein n=1 Tax=uncultured Acinetobacter sp. TaxID=165433 RepID=UPI0026313E8E|nr:DUF4414 domain-containing protein [uncultured Acinetobacter sp.]